jgi:hypothetical protein
MSSSAPQTVQPVTFPDRLAWLQHNIKARVKPYHLAVGAIVGLITAIFGGLIIVLILIATNFNILGWME